MTIVLFTDFGAEGPYLGQMESVIEGISPGSKVINLLSNAPKANPFFSSYLLAALCRTFPAGTIFLAVVDPGVGGERSGVVLEADGRFYVGPDNGLFNTLAIQAADCRWFEIIWQPENCSVSFHGRDIFAPIAARLSELTATECLRPIDKKVAGWKDDLNQIIFFDHYGNAMSGIRYQPAWKGKVLCVRQRLIQQAATFCKVEEGDLFWYVNSTGLIEIAANQASAQQLLELELGDEISVNS